MNTLSKESYKSAIESKYKYVKFTSRKLASIIIDKMQGTPNKDVFSQNTIREINKYVIII